MSNALDKYLAAGGDPEFIIMGRKDYERQLRDQLNNPKLEEVASGMRRLDDELVMAFHMQPLDNGQLYKCCSVCGVAPKRLAEILEAEASTASEQRHNEAEKGGHNR